MEYCPVLNLVRELIQIPSISPFDLGCQRIIAQRLSLIGFKTVFLKYNQTDNLWAYRGNGKTFAFAGHTDVVPIGSKEDWYFPPFTPTIKNGNLFGRGTSDMKGSLAAMIIAAERFILSYPNHAGRIAFLITSDEESSGRDGTIKVIEYLKSINENLDYCIIGEPTSSNILGDTIKIGRRGSLNVNLTVYGKQGHIAYPQLSDNPIHKVLNFLNVLTNTVWSHGNQYFEPTSMQISNISSGLNSDNVIPGEIKIKFNFRYGTDINIEDIKQKVVFLLNQFHLKYKINWKLSGKPFLTRSNYLVNCLQSVIKNFCNVNPNISTSGGTSDGRFIKDITSELLEFGPINRTIHQINESINISDLNRLTVIYENIMKEVILSIE